MQANPWQRFALLGPLVVVITVALEITAKGFPTTGSRLLKVTVAPLTMGFGFGLVSPMIHRFVVLPLQSSPLYRLNPSNYVWFSS
jgi:hypothetical protein